MYRLASSLGSLPASSGVHEAQTLPELGFEAVVQLVDAFLQARVFVDQCFADQHAGHAAVLLGESQQHGEDAFDLPDGVRGLGHEARDQAEQGVFDEFDQPFVHLGLAREMAVERRFRNVQAPRQRRGGDFFRAGLLQHGRQGLQDEQALLARLLVFSSH